jgi:hypothetical protein
MPSISTTTFAVFAAPHTLSLFRVTDKLAGAISLGSDKNLVAPPIGDLATAVTDELAIGRRS